MTGIETRYHGPTNFKGARISARFNGHRVYVSYLHERSGENAHRVAVAAMLKTLVGKATWLDEVTEWLFVESLDGKGYVYVPRIKGLTIAGRNL